MPKSLAVGTKVWAEKINAAWRKSAESVIETGMLLRQAKQVAEPRGFQRMLDIELDFEPSVARKLMAIAGDERIIKACHSARLPKHWTTLYSLHKLSDDALQTALGGDTPITGAAVAKARSDAIDVTHEDITPSADEADTPAIPVSHAAPGSAVPVHPDHPAGSEHAADDREVGESGHHTGTRFEYEVPNSQFEGIAVTTEASVFDNEPGRPGAVAVEMPDPITAAMEFAKRVTADDYFAGLAVNPDHEDVNHFANWIYDFEELVKLAKETEEAEAAA